MKLSENLQKRFINCMPIWDNYKEFIFEQYGNDNKQAIINDLCNTFMKEFRLCLHESCDIMFL